MTVARPPAPAAVPITWRGEPAGFVSRAIAFVIDAVVISLASSGALFAVGAVFDLFSPDTPRTQADDLLGAFTFGLVLGGIALVYFTCSFWLFGRTVGKLALGLRVVRADGERPRFIRSLLRTLGYVLSTFFFFAGYLAVAVSRQRRAWHDHLGRTWVVYDWDARPKLAATDDIEPLPPRPLP